MGRFGEGKENQFLKLFIEIAKSPHCNNKILIHQQKRNTHNTHMNLSLA